METHRILHDFGELSYEELARHSDEERTVTSRKPYQYLFAALLIGLVAGYFLKRK